VGDAGTSKIQLLAPAIRLALKIVLDGALLLCLPAHDDDPNQDQTQDTSDDFYGRFIHISFYLSERVLKR
jgi:hypothetical protein